MIKPVQQGDPSSHRRASSHTRVQFAQFDSMAAMAEQCKIPLGVLKQAKRKGCPFTHHGRCDLIPFLEWAFSQDMDEKKRGDWTAFNVKMGGLIKEEKLNQMRRTTIKFDVVREFLGTLVRDLFFGELARIGEEFPVKLKGKTDVQIAEECGRQLGTVRDNLEHRLSGWVEAMRAAEVNEDELPDEDEPEEES